MRDKLGKFKANSINSGAFSKPLKLESCYWAGFIAADGNLRKSQAKEISIMLNIRDTKHLRKLKKYLKYSGKVNVREYKCTGKVCRISITNTKLFEDLVTNFNVTPIKSLTLKPPKNLTKKQSLAFIAGYIDGDGSIHTSLGKRSITRQLVLNILGTKKMLCWIKNVFNLQNKNLFKIRNIYSFSIGGNRLVPKTLAPILKLKLPLLQRKWSKI